MMMVKVWKNLKYIIKKELVSTAGDDMIGWNKVSDITELCLMRDDSVYTVLSNNEIFTLIYDLCTLSYYMSYNICILMELLFFLSFFFSFSSNRYIMFLHYLVLLYCINMYSMNKLYTHTHTHIYIYIYIYIIYYLSVLLLD